MLDSLRRASKGFVAKLLIALLVISFAIFGISDFVNQVDPTEVARAGDTPVSAREFARVYERVQNDTAQRMGTGLSPEQAVAIGLPNQVLSTLVQDALQLDAARALGLDLGDEALANRIRETDVFAGANGFDRARFDTLLRQAGYSEAEYIDLERDAAAQEMLVNALIGGTTAPETYLRAVNRYANQTRTVAWFPLADSALPPIEDPDEATLRAFYEENKAEFRSPEVRTFDTVTLSADALADPDAVSADDVQAAYDAPGAYGAPERRRVQQVLLDDLDLARRAAEALENGIAFSAILVELDRRFADVDLGQVTRADLVDPAIAEAAFGMAEPGAVAVEGRFGPVLLRVSEIEPPQKRPLEEVEADIRRELALEDARVEVRDLTVSVEDALAGGATAAEIAERFGLPLVAVPAVSRQGTGPDGQPVDVPGGQATLAAAFRNAPGDEPEEVSTDAGTVFVETTAVTEAADRPFEEVATDVLVGWTNEEKIQRLNALAEEAVAALEAGESVETVAARYGATAQTTQPFSRSVPPQSLPSPAPAAAFEGPAGHVASALLPDGRHAILKVMAVEEPIFIENQPDLQQLSATLDDGLANTLLAAFVTAWQAEVGATVNQSVINSIIGLDPNAAR